MPRQLYTSLVVGAVSSYVREACRFGSVIGLVSRFQERQEAVVCPFCGLRSDTRVLDGRGFLLPVQFGCNGQHHALQSVRLRILPGPCVL